MATLAGSRFFSLRIIPSASPPTARVAFIDSVAPAQQFRLGQLLRRAASPAATSYSHRIAEVDAAPVDSVAASARFPQTFKNTGSAD